MQIFARRGKRFTRGKFEIPQLVLHPAIEFLRVFLPLHVEFDAYCCILRINLTKLVQNRTKNGIFETFA